MSYKNDHFLTIANQYGKASNDAKAMVFETYDKLRDLTVSGPGIGGSSSFGYIGQFLLNLSRLIGPSYYTPLIGNTQINIPGTSYFSPITGGYSTIPGAGSAFGMKNLGKYPGFPDGGAAPIPPELAFALEMGAPLLSGIGSAFIPLANTFSIGGEPTGGASPFSPSVPGGQSYLPAAGLMQGISAASGQAQDLTLPVAGVVGGVGGLLTHLAPYFGPTGLVAALAGNLFSGYAGSVASTYSYITSRIINNADTILTMKIKNLETTVKQLDVQGDVVRKMLKSSLESDSKSVQDM